MSTKAEDNGFACPSCERSLPTEHGLKQHHAKVHNESLVDKVHECDRCGTEFERYESRMVGERKFCSKECKYKSHSNQMSADHPFRGEALSTPKVEDGDYMEQVYADEGLNSSEIADRFGCSQQTILNWLKEHGISIRPKHTWDGENNPRTTEPLKKNCSNCGAELPIYPSRAEKYNHWFCDQNCRDEWLRRNAPTGENNPNWRGGWVDYCGPNWEEKRQRALERDGCRCQDCGMTEIEHIESYSQSLHVHHIIPRREFRDDSELNYKKANQVENLITLCAGCHKKWEKMVPLKPQFA